MLLEYVTAGKKKVKCARWAAHLSDLGRLARRYAWPWRCQTYMHTYITFPAASHCSHPGTDGQAE